GTPARRRPPDARGQERGRRPHARRARLPSPGAGAVRDRVVRARRRRALSELRLFLAAVLLSLAAPGAAADRLLAWSVTGSDGRGRAVCQDGDTHCDRTAPP